MKIKTNKKMTKKEKDLTLSEAKSLTNKLNRYKNQTIDKEYNLSEIGKKSITTKIDLSKLKNKIFNKLTDERKVQYYLFFDIIEEFCGEDYIMNNFIQMVNEIDDIELLNKLDKFIDKKIKENKLQFKTIKSLKNIK